MQEKTRLQLHKTEKTSAFLWSARGSRGLQRRERWRSRCVASWIYSNAIRLWPWRRRRRGRRHGRGGGDACRPLQACAGPPTPSFPRHGAFRSLGGVWVVKVSCGPRRCVRPVVGGGLVVPKVRKRLGEEGSVYGKLWLLFFCFNNTVGGSVCERELSEGRWLEWSSCFSCKPLGLD